MEIIKINDDTIKIDNSIYKIITDNKRFIGCFKCILSAVCAHYNASMNHTICTEIQSTSNIKMYNKYLKKFIEIDMETKETKEIKITPPEGYEIDKENSTFDCIKFKKTLRWRDDKLAKISGYCIDKVDSTIFKINNLVNEKHNFNIFTTEKQAKSAIAMARISQIMANDKRFGGVIADIEWTSEYLKYGIDKVSNKINRCTIVHTGIFLAFHTLEQRDLFLQENEDLVKDYLMID